MMTGVNVYSFKSQHKVGPINLNPPSDPEGILIVIIDCAHGTQRPGLIYNHCLAPEKASTV